MTETTTPDGAAFQNLSDLLTPSKEANLEFPGYDGFKIKVTYLAREELLKLRKKSVSTKINRRTRQPEEELNEEDLQFQNGKQVYKKH